MREVEALEHKSRRQDVLVDEELIYAFYDQQLPPDVTSGARLRALVPRRRPRHAPNCCKLTRDELMRHEAAGITTSAFPRTVRLGGVDCAASYLHAPGDARDGLTVTVPLFVLNQVQRGALRVAGARHAQGQDPGAAQEPARSARAAASCRCPSRPRGWPQLLGTPERMGRAGLLDALLKQVRDETSLDVKRADFKLDMLPRAPVHELPRRRRARPPAWPGPQPRRAQGRVGREGARRVPGAGFIKDSCQRWWSDGFRCKST